MSTLHHAVQGTVLHHAVQGAAQLRPNGMLRVSDGFSSRPFPYSAAGR